MTESEKLFQIIIKELPSGIEGKMFGAKCIKSTNGKTAAIYLKESMVFKLDEQTQEDALKLEGAKIGSHLYAPEKPMKRWISIPERHSDKWSGFAEKALEYVDGLNK